MRVWIDLTNSPHVLVMRPVIERLRTAGHEVQVTARDFAQTLGLCERFGLECTAIGRHRGEGLAAKAAGLASRSLALVRWAREQSRGEGGGGFDIALGHGSNDVCVAAGLLRIPSSTMFDYEWATLQHSVNCRLARAVVVPEVIPEDRKSTRLNSSHSQISYAVFCLENKNNRDAFIVHLDVRVGGFACHRSFFSGYCFFCQFGEGGRFTVARGFLLHAPPAR